MTKYFFFILLLIYGGKLQSQTFVDVAAIQNVNASYSSVDELTGGGISFYDFDNDGWDDLTFLQYNDSLKFYRNNHGTFELIQLAIYDTGQAKHAIWVDYDNDDQNDLFVTFFNGPVKLYKNTGNLNFIDYTLQAGLSSYIGANQNMCFGDFNMDGYLDLFIGRYSYESDNSLVSEKNVLLRNNGDGTFYDDTHYSFIDVGINQTLASTWLDYNKDGLPDLYVVTDRHYIDNNLFKNNGNETFSDVAPSTGSTANNTDGMTSTVGDFDNDGDLDIFITNIGILDTCRFLVNNNNTSFTESAAIYNVANMQATWGASWIDADSDGYLDLIVVTQIGAGDPRNYLYMNLNGNGFIETPQNFQSNAIADSRGIANGDINNDGRTDCLVGNSVGYNSFLWQNTGTSGNYIKMTLHGTVSNKMAIGSWIEIYAGGITYSHYTKCGENYLSQNSQHLIFGLGQSNIIDSISIKYTSGINDKYYDIDVNQVYHFYEGETYQNQINYNSALSFCSGDSVILNAGNYASYLWSDSSTQQNLTVTQSGIYWIDVTDTTGLIIPSDTLIIDVGNTPLISINAEDVSCEGAADGSIILDIVNQTSNYTLQWNQGMQGDTLLNLLPGSYTFEYEDMYGCEYVDSISIYSPYALNVMSQINQFTQFNFGSINSIINGGTEPYSIYLNGNLESNLIDSLLPGNYFYEVIDANGCIYSSNIEILDATLTGLTTNNNFYIIIQNPVIENDIPIKSSEKIFSVSVYNTLGQEISASYENNVLHLSDNYKGIICLKITTVNGERYFKILKQ
jgi:hypothetical protein